MFVRKKQLRLLVARIDRIGDVVLSTPIPREVKSARRGSYVAILVRQETKDIYLNNPYVDSIITIDENKWNVKPFWSMVNELRRHKFTHAFMLLPQERLNWILFWCGIKNRIGVSRKLYQFLSFTKYISRNKYIPLRHEADYCLDMVRRIGIEPKEIFPEIYLSDEEKVKRDELRKELKSEDKLIIGVNATSGKSAPNLTVNEYKNLIDLLSNDGRFKVVVTDHIPPDELLNIDGVEYFNVDKTLREKIINFSALDYLISASTGPMHICAALKVKTVALFCPLPACSPRLWGPLGNESEVILPEENYCSIVCPGDPHICDFSGQGGINSSVIYKRLCQQLNI